MTKLEIYLIGVLVIGLLLAGAYFKGDANGAERMQAKWDKSVVEQKEAEEKLIASASTKLENGNAQAKVVYRTITQTVDKIVDRPVYKSLCLDDDGLRTANQALGGTLEVIRKPDATVPRPATPGGRDSRISIAKAGRSF